MTAHARTYDMPLVGHYPSRLTCVAAAGAAVIPSRSLAEFVGQPSASEPFAGALDVGAKVMTDRLF